MLLQTFKQRVRRVKALHPHFASLIAGQRGIPPGASRCLQQQSKQTLGGAKVGAEQSAVRVECSHQRHASEVVSLGHHLRTHQQIHIAVMHLGQLAHQLAFAARRVSINPGDAQRHTVRPLHVVQQFCQMLFDSFRAVAQCANVLVAAGRAGARHRLRQTAMVTAQAAVGFVEHPVSAAMRAFAFPAAGLAMEHRRIATAVEQHQHLLALRDALSHGL